MDKQLDGLKIALLVTTGFEEVELTKPREALQETGAETHLVSPKEGPITAWDIDDWGDDFEVDILLEDAEPNNYDALVLPGGVLNPDHLRVDKKAVAFTKSFFEAGKPVAAICHGPWTLIEAGVVEGRRMTSYPSLRTDLINAGADWVDEEVVVDDKLVTSRNPDDLPAFNEEIINTFAVANKKAPVSS